MCVTVYSFQPKQVLWRKVWNYCYKMNEIVIIEQRWNEFLVRIAKNVPICPSVQCEVYSQNQLCSAYCERINFNNKYKTYFRCLFSPGLLGVLATGVPFYKKKAISRCSKQEVIKILVLCCKTTSRIIRGKCRGKFVYWSAIGSITSILRSNCLQVLPRISQLIEC